MLSQRGEFGGYLYKAQISSFSIDWDLNKHTQIHKNIALTAWKVNSLERNWPERTTRSIKIPLKIDGLFELNGGTCTQGTKWAVLGYNRKFSKAAPHWIDKSQGICPCFPDYKRCFSASKSLSTGYSRGSCCWLNFQCHFSATFCLL